MGVTIRMEMCNICQHNGIKLQSDIRDESLQEPQNW